MNDTEAKDLTPEVGLQARVSLPSREDCEIGAFNGEMTTLEYFLWEWTPDTEPEATSFRDALAEVLNERRAG